MSVLKNLEKPTKTSLYLTDAPEQAKECHEDLPPPPRGMKHSQFESQTVFQFSQCSDVSLAFFINGSIFLCLILTSTNSDRFTIQTMFFVVPIYVLFFTVLLSMALFGAYRSLNQVRIQLSLSELRVWHSLFPFGPVVCLRKKKITRLFLHQDSLMASLTGGSEKKLCYVPDRFQDYLTDRIPEFCAEPPDPRQRETFNSKTISCDRTLRRLELTHRAERCGGLWFQSLFAFAWYAPLMADAIFSLIQGNFPHILIVGCFLYHGKKILLPALKGWFNGSHLALDPEGFEFKTGPLDPKTLTVECHKIGSFYHKEVIENDEESQRVYLYLRLNDGEELEIAELSPKKDVIYMADALNQHLESLTRIQDPMSLRR
jgi:hypothetical protein